MEERETVDGCMCQIEFLDADIAEVERLIAQDALGSVEIRRLMSVPGVNTALAWSRVRCGRIRNPVIYGGCRKRV
jgi:hypothetical protein